MSLLGGAAMAAWHNLEPGVEAAHDEWHSHEHLFERVSIPGFRRGRRCRSVGGGEEYFLMYEVDDLSVLTSEAYLERLNNPTPWSRRIIPSIRNMTRVLCRVVASSGGGMGGWVATLRLTARPGMREGWAGEWVGSLAVRAGVTGAHLLATDAEASGLPTEEKRLRGLPDATADLVLLVEGYDAEALRCVVAEELGEERLWEKGAERGAVRGFYRVCHAVSEGDLPG